MEYEVLDTHPDELRERLTDLRGEHMRGLNLTTPLKRVALELCASLSPRAVASGAVNVLTATPEGWHGDNTDGSGFWRDLSIRQRWPNKKGTILVIGSGGAARGVVERLLAESCDIALGVRHLERGQLLVKNLEQQGGYAPIPVYDLHTLPKDPTFQLIVNATSAGLTGTRPDLDQRVFADQPWVYDLSYGEAARPFLLWAADHGAGQVMDGLGMLVEQAAESFMLWTGRSCDTDLVYAMLRTEYPLPVEERCA